ncbi:MAG: hypothetical protein GY702_21030, partial [Desulfobulbaceae bacterium]|nr:hypothetical protein [Desulfobulbaceae bacterium]
MFTKSALMYPNRVLEPLWWVGHIPFVMWLVEKIKPEILVELGVHKGNSYFAMCHSVKLNELSTSCYAVDTWKGDLHEGFYEEDVYCSVKEYNDINYSKFSELLRMTFDDAISVFSEGTIDLLHIDGFHTYDAVRHDFEEWLPKLSDRAIVLFHDVTVKKLDFGVWRLWEELSEKYPNILFDYSQGLGVLFVGNRQPMAINDLLKSWATKEERGLVHQFFERLGRAIEFEYSTANLNQALMEREAQETELKQSVADFEEKVNSLNQIVHERDGQISSVNQALMEREAQETELKQSVADFEAQETKLKQSVADFEEKVNSLNQIVHERDGQINSVNQALMEREAQETKLKQSVADFEEKVNSLNQIVHERDGQINSVNQALMEREAQETKLKQS